jgi:hypothetical protein
MMDTPPCVTLSGRVVDLADPAPDQIFPLDIAHALGNMCVLGGHTSRFYSVAEHALNVAALLPTEQRLRALLMFAPAAYLPALGWDAPTPVAGMVTPHRLLVEAIHARFDLPAVLPPSPEIHAAVAMVRHAILRDLFSRHPLQNAYPMPPRFMNLGTGLSSHAARLGYLQKLQHHGGDTACRQPMWTGRLVAIPNEKAPA